VWTADDDGLRRAAAIHTLPDDLAKKNGEPRTASPQALRTCRSSEAVTFASASELLRSALRLNTAFLYYRTVAARNHTACRSSTHS
jgi:hypothetical protein